MNSIEDLIAPLRHSPRLPQVVAQLQQQLEQESQRRQRLYEEINPDQKVEFIEGAVVVQSLPGPSNWTSAYESHRYCRRTSIFINLGP